MDKLKPCPFGEGHDTFGYFRESLCNVAGCNTCGIEVSLDTWQNREIESYE